MYANVGAATVAAALAWSATASAQASVFEEGPYLADLSSHSVVVRTETENAETLTLTVEPGHHSVSDATATDGVHTLSIDGLDSKTTYHYTVRSSRGGKEEGAFTTAPSDGDVSDVRFVLYGDDRGGTATHELLVKRVTDEPFDFILDSGDLVADGRIGSQWEGFFDIEGRLLRDHCLFTAIGNHELVQENGASFLKYFGTAEQREKHVFYTTFRWGFLRVFVINGEGNFLGDDRTWLERELQKSDNEPNLRWRIVLVHDGPFSSGTHGDNPKLHGADIPELLRQHHVDFVLSGHDHVYERGASDGLRYVVSGGAGAPLYKLKHLRSTTRKFESTYHYVLFEMSTDRGRVISKRLDGSVIEEVGFTKTNMWNDDGPVIAPANANAAAPAPVSATPDVVATHAPATPSGRGAYVFVGVLLAIGVSWGLTRLRAKKPVETERVAKTRSRP
ncbi:MAG TPA: metallophosphoesterase [Polyangiaceae bacterium]